MARLLSRLGIPWEYVTRTIGLVMVGYGLFFDDSAERGTIILAGVGFLGYEFVQKSEPKQVNKRSDSSKHDGTA
jgi:hypothetical protein